MNRKAKKIFHLVCPNGMGHFKRTVEIWSELIDQMSVEVTIACEDWQCQKFKNHRGFEKLQNNPHVRFEFFDLNGTLRWSDLSNLQLNEYQATIERVKNHEQYEEADLIISDNLLGLISSAKEALILGSFLWHDVLKESSGGGINEQVYQHEASLLENSKAKLVSVKDVTMPALQSCEENIRLAWFCKDVYDRPVQARENYKVLFSAGLSGADTGALSALISEFAYSPKYSIYLSPALAQKTNLEEESFAIFDFEEASFRSLDLMIARPGVGALTEAIKYQIPMLAVDNGDNSEMLFNAIRLQQLGYGWDGISRIPNRKELERDYQSKLLALKTCKVDGFKDLEKIIKESLEI